jgi:hypothetical protein
MAFIEGMSETYTGAINETTPGKQIRTKIPWNMTSSAKKRFSRRIFFYPYFVSSRWGQRTSIK